MLDGNFDVRSLGFGADDFDCRGQLREMRRAAQRGDNRVLDFRNRSLDSGSYVFFSIDFPRRRVLDDAGKDDGVRDDDALARPSSQGRQTNANLFDATFHCANPNIVPDPKGPFDENVNAVDETAADILKGETDTKRGGAEDGGDGSPTGANNRQDNGAADGINAEDRKSTRLNSSHANISYAVFCLKKKT